MRQRVGVSAAHLLGLLVTLAVLAALAGVAACSPRSASPSAPGDSTSSDSGTTSGNTTPPAPGTWHLAFKDDFPGTSLDPAKWVTCYDFNNNGCTNATNGELEWYLPGQVTVAHGTVTLTAQRKDTAGSDGHVYPWTSGMLSTGRPSWNSDPRFAFTYGYVQASVKMPAGDWPFPAFWLLSADEKGFPEIDIAEQYHTGLIVHMTLHWHSADGKEQGKTSSYGPLDYSAGYHDFGVDWEPGQVTWYIDGVPRFSVSDNVAVPAAPMEILFTLAAGGVQTPPADATHATMNIRNVQVWQH